MSIDNYLEQLNNKSMSEVTAKLHEWVLSGALNLDQFQEVMEAIVGPIVHHLEIADNVAEATADFLFNEDEEQQQEHYDAMFDAIDLWLDHQGDEEDQLDQDAN